MSRESIEKAISICGTQQALVAAMKPHLPERLAVSLAQGHISGWLRRPRRSPVPPAEYVPAMVQAVGGQISAAEFRPDLSGLFPADDTAAA